MFLFVALRSALHHAGTWLEGLTVLLDARPVGVMVLLRERGRLGSRQE